MINKKIIATIAALGILATAAEATPAYAKQMNAECMTCHFQNIPKLNSFGRSFKMSGFTMTGGIPEVTGNHLSIPATFNLGFVVKARLQNGTSNTGVSENTLEVYDESALLFGGKLGEHMGSSFELGGGAGLAISGKILYSNPTDLGNFGLGIYNTDALGAFAATEMFTTGLYRPVRQFENRGATSIFQKLGIGAGAATGATAFYYGNGLFVSVAGFLPAHAQAADISQGLNIAARAAYSADLAGWNVTLGGFSLSGDSSSIDTTIGNIWAADAQYLNRSANGLDFQVEGAIADMSVMLTAALVLEDKYTVGAGAGTWAIDPITNLNVFTAGAAASLVDNGGFDIAVQVNVLEHLGLKVAYLSYDDKTAANKDTSSMSIGTNYSFYQNVDLVAEYSVTTEANAAATATKDPTNLLLMAEIAF